MAHLFVLLGSWGMLPTREVMPLARAMATKARELDPSASRAQAELAVVSAVLDFDWRVAEEHYHRAKDAGGFAPKSRFRCAIWILGPQGKFSEAIREIEIAIEQDPLSALVRSALGLILALSGQYERAIAESTKALELEPAFWTADVGLSWAYTALGQFAEAREVLEKGMRVSLMRTFGSGMLAGVLSRLGQQEQADELIRNSQGEPIALSYYHLIRSEFEEALSYYERAVAHRHAAAIPVASAKFLEPMRASPRWPAIAKMMNLAARGSESGPT